MLPAGAGIWTSANGIQWTRTYAGDPSYPFTSLAWSGENLVAVGTLYAVAISP